MLTTLSALPGAVRDVRSVDDDSVRQLDERTVSHFADRARLGSQWRKSLRPRTDLANWCEIDGRGEIDDAIDDPDRLDSSAACSVRELVRSVNAEGLREVAVR